MYRKKAKKVLTDDGRAPKNEKFTANCVFAFLLLHWLWVIISLYAYVLLLFSFTRAYSFAFAFALFYLYEYPCATTAQLLITVHCQAKLKRRERISYLVHAYTRAETSARKWIYKQTIFKVEQSLATFSAINSALFQMQQQQYALK